MSKKDNLKHFCSVNKAPSNAALWLFGVIITILPTKYIF